METSRRTLMKSVLWTLIGLVAMSIVGLIYTGSIALGGKMAVMNAALGLAMYVVYERIWARIGWGRNA